MVNAMGLTIDHGDGNDPDAVYRITSDAITRIRTGGGPQFLEFSTYRWREHCGPNYDNDIGYRTEAEFLDWKARDPVATFERKLLESGRLSQFDIDDMNRRIDMEVVEAFAFAEASPFPESADAGHNVFSA
jgi:pyruvate dehydrogenase E1 component alpha subunit